MRMRWPDGNPTAPMFSYPLKFWEPTRPHGLPLSRGLRYLLALRAGSQTAGRSVSRSF